ncbi:hypothetical protein RQ479_06185 [Mesorhizobium sp. ISC25]|uniref:hypothetical protein n=1 Tax=Mesorhizobium sp. ISC25 TaxID=3077335 RepID=UPI0035D9B607
MVQSFAATVGRWALKVDSALQVIFQESAQELVSQLDQLLVGMVYDQPQPAGYVRTGVSPCIADASAISGTS